MAYTLSIKRAYEAPAKEDGFRILVDRLWPRGIKKEALALDMWAKEVTPSPEIRKAFGHLAERFEAFRSAYLQELAGNPEAPAFAKMVEDTLKKEPVTLIYAAKSPEINHARVLVEWLDGQIGGKGDR